VVAGRFDYGQGAMAGLRAYYAMEEGAGAWLRDR
jgi:hypothetical protein